LGLADAAMGKWQLAIKNLLFFSADFINYFDCRFKTRDKLLIANALKD